MVSRLDGRTDIQMSGQNWRPPVWTLGCLDVWTDINTVRDCERICPEQVKLVDRTDRTKRKIAYFPNVLTVLSDGKTAA